MLKIQQIYFYSFFAPFKVPDLSNNSINMSFNSRQTLKLSIIRKSPPQSVLVEKFFTICDKRQKHLNLLCLTLSWHKSQEVLNRSLLLLEIYLLLKVFEDFYDFVFRYVTQPFSKGSGLSAFQTISPKPLMREVRTSRRHLQAEYFFQG